MNDTLTLGADNMFAKIFFIQSCFLFEIIEYLKWLIWMSDSAKYKRGVVNVPGKSILNILTANVVVYDVLLQTDIHIYYSHIFYRIIYIFIIQCLSLFCLKVFNSPSLFSLIPCNFQFRNWLRPVSTGSLSMPRCCISIFVNGENTWEKVDFIKYQTHFLNLPKLLSIAAILFSCFYVA